VAEITEFVQLFSRIVDPFSRSIWKISTVSAQLPKSRSGLLQRM